MGQLFIFLQLLLYCRQQSTIQRILNLERKEKDYESSAGLSTQSQTNS